MYVLDLFVQVVEIVDIPIVPATSLPEMSIAARIDE